MHTICISLICHNLCDNSERRCGLSGAGYLPALNECVCVRVCVLHMCGTHMRWHGDNIVVVVLIARRRQTNTRLFGAHSILLLHGVLHSNVRHTLNTRTSSSPPPLSSEVIALGPVLRVCKHDGFPTAL